MRLTGVGVGPGDPDLVTLRALTVLRAAGRVFVPTLGPDEAGRAEAIVRAHVPESRVERLVFALNERTDTTRRERHWDAAGARVAEWLRSSGGTAAGGTVAGGTVAGGTAGGTAAFATIGDPNVYSTFGYLAQTVAGLVPGLTVDTVPGVTAMQALSSAAGVPLVEGAEPLVLVPLARDATPLRDALAYAPNGTVVAYKAGRHLDTVRACLAAAGRLDTAVYGAHLGLPGQDVRPLSTVDAGPAPYLSTVVVPARRSLRGGAL
jgi:precorrin-2/cobalt-factor-2 C20-methyltransferase